jgi:hypothetical protein
MNEISTLPLMRTAGIAEKCCPASAQPSLRSMSPTHFRLSFHSFPLHIQRFDHAHLSPGRMSLDKTLYTIPRAWAARALCVPNPGCSHRNYSHKRLERCAGQSVIRAAPGRQASCNSPGYGEEISCDHLALWRCRYLCMSIYVCRTAMTRRWTGVAYVCEGHVCR